MAFIDGSPMAMAEELGRRLKQARLAQDLTQTDVAERVGISRKAVLNAEKGQAQLAVFIAIMAALNLTGQLDLFLPRQPVSPLQLAKLQGKQRQRASWQKKKPGEDTPQW